MNEHQANDQVQRFNLNLILVIGVAVVLIVGGLLIFQKATTTPDCVGQGPCMLYFYTDW